MPFQSSPFVQRSLRYAAGALIGCAAPATILGKSLGFVLAAALICFAIAAVYQPIRLKHLLPTRATLRAPLFWALAAMLTMWLISALWTLDPPHSPLIWLQCLGVVVLGWLLTRLLADDPLAHTAALRATIIAALATGIFGCLVLYVAPSLLTLVRNRPIAEAYQARDLIKSFGSVLPPVAFIAVYAGHRLGGAWRWAGYATVPIALAFAVGVHSAAGLVGFAGGLAVLGVFYVASRRSLRAGWLAIGVPLLLALAFAGWLVARLPAPPVTSASQITVPTWLIDRHRQVIWGFALHSAVRGPIFGYGLNTAGRVPGAKDQIGLFKGQYIPSHTHNWLVQLRLETGLPGTLTALAALACLLSLLYARARRGSGAAWAALGMTGSVFVSWLFNFSLFAGWWQMVFATLLAIPLATLSQGNARPPPPGLTEADGAPRTEL